MVRRICCVLALAIAAFAPLQLSIDGGNGAPAAAAAVSEIVAPAGEHTPTTHDEGHLGPAGWAAASAGIVVGAAQIPARTVGARHPSLELCRFLVVLLGIISGAFALRSGRRRREALLPARHTLALLGARPLRAPPAFAASR